MPSRCSCPFMCAMLPRVDTSGMNAALDGSVFGREAERIPSKRMQDVVAPHALGARNDVTDDVVAYVADMRVT